MIYLKLDKNKTLTYNQQDELYEGESYTNEFSILLPNEINGIEIEKYTMLFYLKKDNNEGDAIRFSKDENLVILDNIHISNTNYITVWLVGQYNKNNFSSNELKFRVHRKANIIDPPSPPYVTYFEQMKQDLENMKIPTKVSELENDLGFIALGNTSEGNKIILDGGTAL